MEQTETPGKDQELVILYGDALFLQSIEACADGAGKIGLVELLDSAMDAPQRLKSLHPDLVVMEYSGDRCGLAVSLLREQPGISILCVDREHQEAIVLCGQAYATPTAEDLTEIIRRHVKGGAAGRVPGQGEWYQDRPDFNVELADLVQTKMEEVR